MAIDKKQVAGDKGQGTKGIQRAIITSMRIFSSAFQNNGTIPAKYTCDGENLNPPLTISGVPNTSKSLVLIMDDPDLPSTILNGRFTHWLIWNVPVNTLDIKEGAAPIGVEGKNSSDGTGYTGACPPKEHRYFFKLFALDTELDLNPELVGQDDLMLAMQGHIIEQTELMGRYERP